ncbi:hypothetical protein TRIUR3_13360 [Triticum urartu]|uniref:Uncharacterized protein n=1 Tax=Triticum urartu TaxID=4572 RepID=M7YFW5_TRIUA|nr:hypothetical protein TRIUR3_13360 [Triticum urartu]
MSGAPKRSHEEGSHSTPAKRPLDDSSLYSSPSGKLIQPGGSDFHGPFEHDGRFTKVPRVESRDDKRPPLTHRMPVGSSNFVDHPTSSDSRLESKQNKDARDTKVDDREAKADARDVHSDSRIEFPGNKAETDVKTNNRADDTEIRVDRRAHGDFTGDVVKSDKDSHPTGTSNIAWKDNKDHRGKRYVDQPDDTAGWRFLRPGMQGTDETLKVQTIVEERSSKDAHESTGENKIEPKSEDKFRDKDRRKKDEKYRDFGARDADRNDRRIGSQLAGGSVERREIQRDDRDAEKWDRERKDSQKDKENNDREKDSAKKDSFVAVDKENTILEKTASDGATLKDDTWKSHDRDLKDKKREKDVDTGDRHDQRSKYNDKESDDTGPEGDTEKDKDTFGSIQRRRMARPKGGSQASQREPRFRSKMRDGEGSQGKSEVSAIVYKAGECMQELLKSWKEFEATPDARNAENQQNGPTLEIRIPAEFVTSTNRQVKGAQLWGTDVYTNDSDLVAGYTSTLRNNVRSRAWGAGIGCSFRIERCCIVKNALRQQRFVREVTIQYNLCNEPWLKYSISIVADKGLKKSLYTSARLKKGEVIYLETHFNRYELCFSGEKPRSIGSNSNASDLEPEKHQNNSHHHLQNGDRGATEHELRDVFRWSRCKKAMPEVAMRSIGIPLPAEQVEVLQDNLEWEDVQWSQTGVWVSGKEYPLARVHFLSAN